MIKRVAALALLGLFLSACSSSEDGQTLSPTIEISSHQAIGQTFVAGWDGLNGIVVHLAPNGPVPDILRVELFVDVDDGKPLWGGDIPLPADQGPAEIRIPIEMQPESAGHGYFITFRTESDRVLALSTGPGHAYLDGALHQDGRPLDRQLEFGLKYHPVRLAAGMLRDTLPVLGVLAGFAWLFTLPGWALFSAFWSAWARQGAFTRVMLATGAGVAVYPILLLPPWLVGVGIGRALAWTVPLAAAVSFLLRYRRGVWKPDFRFSRPDLWTVLTAAALLAVLVSRLLPLQTLPAGMWGDSYHHTLITQLIVERGGLFSSWEPYAPVVTFTYHYGFHTTAAVMSWVLGLDAARSVLWAGQIFNFLAVAALAPLVGALLEREPEKASPAWLPGLVAVVAAGLLAPMPAFYTNWGRYTQVAGQFLMVVWMVVALDLFRSGRRDWRREIPGWILLAGLALTHYRVLIYTILFIAAYWLVHIRRDGLFQAAASIWRAGSGAALLCLPWFWNVFAGELIFILGTLLGTPAESVAEPIRNYSRLDGDLTRYLPAAIWGLLPLVLVWGMARRNRETGLIALWSLFLFAVANPHWLGLPGAGAINNFAVLIAAYIPAAILLGIGAKWLAALIRDHMPPAARWALPAGVSAFLLLCAWGAAGQVDLINPDAHALVTRPDLAAFAWIDDNLPEDAVFLVNFFPTETGAVAGSDGGWWLPFYTRRESVLPPFIFISEKTKSPDLRLDLLDLAAALRAGGPADPAFLDRLDAFGVTHIYLGQRQGGVNSQGTRIEIDPLLDDDENFELVYRADRVWIFAVSDD
ncbi:MAG TPA: hypothetical protein VMN57_02260 [Anaerolineales bacterium]|nr:hypothetical protein [Anaerolineales bacterium]